MNTFQQQEWIDEANRHILAALANEPELTKAIIFKGAWILNLHLKDHRHSGDLDANADYEWAAATPDLVTQKEFFEKTVDRAVTRYFERQSPVRFTVTETEVTVHPLRAHPRNWNAFLIKVRLKDALNPDTTGLPAVQIDVAAPERLGAHAVTTMEFFGAPANVYTLNRIAGEKLRAYLTSLPQYRAKMKGGYRAFRVKDLFDQARILRACPIENTEFWNAAVEEFKLACESRLVDCAGPETFFQEWALAEKAYTSDATLRRIPFAEAESALKIIITYLAEKKMFPLSYPR
ncbi:MAG: nucleotidyl transferase AbiEii/AbiGii toxin family protein [Lacunisphaera sp.]|nr:nucleotidyl transferase AbiEii/AbiGii toxin family protein [Lacunisphaera sp.]